MLVNCIMYLGDQIGNGAKYNCVIYLPRQAHTGKNGVHSDACFAGGSMSGISENLRTGWTAANLWKPLEGSIYERAGTFEEMKEKTMLMDKALEMCGKRGRNIP